MFRVALYRHHVDRFRLMRVNVNRESKISAAPVIQPLQIMSAVSAITSPMFCMNSTSGREG